MPKKRYQKHIAILFIFLGVGLISFTSYPLLKYEIYDRNEIPFYTQNENFPFVEDLAQEGKNFRKVGSLSSEYEIDYEKKDGRFVYRISIPKIKVEDAVVNVGGEDLSKSLIQFPGTAYPGEVGNTVVFGHSVLPYFYNPRNYLTIFSNLPKLTKGDEVFVEVNGVLFKYEIFTLFEVKPDNLDILVQPFDSSYLSLVTCVPPGHPLKPKRLVVLAKLANT